MLELYSKRHHSMVSSWWCIEDVLVYVMAVIYFWKVSVHWIWYALFGQFCTVASILILVFLIPESPRFLASQERYDEVVKSFKKMARVDKRPVDFSSIWQIKLVKSDWFMLTFPVSTLTEADARDWLRDALNQSDVSIT